MFKAYLKSSHSVLLDLKAMTLDDAILETKARYQEDYRDRVYYDIVSILDVSSETILDNNDWILEVGAQIEQEKRDEEERIERQRYEVVKRNYEQLRVKFEGTIK